MDGSEELAGPEWRPVALVAAPRLGNVYWCDFHPPEHVHLPEMWKQRPVIVVSHRCKTIKGAVQVVPTSTDPQDKNDWAFEVPDYVSARLDGRRSWAICNHVITVSTSRFMQVKGGPPKLQRSDINDVLGLVLDWFPKPIT